MRRIILALCLITAPAAAQTPEKTPASAFAFIQSSMGDGSWTGLALICDDESGYCRNENGYRITQVQAYAGSYCNLQFTLRIDTKPFQITRRIDLTKNFEIWDSGGTLFFDGPVVLSNNEIANRWSAETTNYDAKTRVIKALQFLQAACKPATPW